MTDICVNLDKVRSDIVIAEKNAGREEGAARLLAVSKTYPVEAIMEAYNHGQRMFGENKVQELEVKAPALPNDIEWHLIGHLQSNKVAKAVEYASYIHSVDSVKLVNRINRLAEEKNRKIKILLEVNISGEESKFGITSVNVNEMIEAALAGNNLELVGFMTMAPFGADENTLKAVFGGLCKLRDDSEEKYSVKLPELSMGMSADFKEAIEEGSTIVRVGTAIFGKRNYI